MSDNISLLPWDSEFFGFGVSSIRSPRPDRKILEEADQFAKDHNIRCTHSLVEADHVEGFHTLQNFGYNYVDIRLTLIRKTVAVPDIQQHAYSYRSATEEDIPRLRSIAEQSHHDSRYYTDPNFSREKCDEFYATWIENSCQGFADRVIAADTNGQPVGYITCKLQSNQGVIGLFAVDTAAQGKGVGKNLIRSALSWFEEQGCEAVSVVTQGCNIHAQQVYQKAGFISGKIQFWFHKWHPAEGLSHDEHI